jgi:protein-disulfide isomerase
MIKLITNNKIKIFLSVLLAIILWFVFVYNNNISSKENNSNDIESTKDYRSDISSDLLVTGSLEDRFIGNENAPITIIEYASMTCSHCADFHAGVYPELKEKYVDTGIVKFIFREFPIDQLAVALSMLGRCVEDEKYFPFINILFRQRAQWLIEQPIEPLKNLSKQAGLTNKLFDQCLKDQELLDSLLSSKKYASEKLAVTSTPTFFINNKMIIGSQSFETFENEIQNNIY